MTELCKNPGKALEKSKTLCRLFNLVIPLVTAHLTTNHFLTSMGKTCLTPYRITHDGSDHDVLLRLSLTGHPS